MMLPGLSNLARHWRAMAIVPVAAFGISSWPKGSSTGALLVVVGTAALVLAAFLANGVEPDSGSSLTWAMAATVCVFMLTCLPPMSYRFGDSLPAGLRASIGGLALISIAVDEDRRRLLQRGAGLALIAIVALSAALHIYQNPDPKTDVIYGNRAAAEVLFDGSNPYSDAVFPDTSPSYANVGTIPGYSYPPVSMVPLAVMERLGDSRWLSLAAVVASAVVALWLACAWTSHGVLLIGCVLAYPMLGALIVHGWTEPLQLILLVTSGLLFTRPVVSGVFAGLAVASKQYMVLALIPMLPIADRGRVKRIGVATVVATASVAPFVLWDAGSFWDAVVGFQLDRVQRLDTLSVASFGVHVPIMLAAGLAVLVAVLLGLRLGNPFRVAIVQAASLATYFTLSSNSFRNYYWLVAMVAVFAVADGRRAPTAEHASPEGVPQLAGG
jgi:hypothetical protein